MSSKEKYSETQSIKDYEMPIIQTPMTNRFQILSDFPPLTYAQATQPQITAFKLHQPLCESLKLINPFKKPLHTLPNSYSTYNSHKTSRTPPYNSLLNFTQRIFLEGCCWCPNDPSKTLKCYELILLDTESVEIYNRPNEENYFCEL